LGWLADQMAKHSQSLFYLERLQPDWLPKKLRWANRFSNQLVDGTVIGLLLGLLGTLFAILGHRPAAQVVFILFGSLFTGLVLGLVRGLLEALSVGPSSMRRETISCVETLHWSWKEFWSAIREIGLVYGLVSGLVYWLIAGLIFGRAVGQLVGLFGGLFMALAFGCGGALTVREIEERTVPNEGIRRSAQNAFHMAILAGLGGGLVGGVLGWLFGDPRYGLVAGPFIGLLSAFSGWSNAGGDALRKHLILRYLLIRNRSIPWNYVKFLKFAADRILLRKVGGGFAFIHRMLLEHFAARYIGSSVEVATRANPTGIE
jgi:hypothetical protein